MLLSFMCEGMWLCPIDDMLSPSSICSCSETTTLRTAGPHLCVLRPDAVLKLFQLRLLQRANLRLPALPLCALPGLQQLLSACASKHPVRMHSLCICMLL